MRILKSSTSHRNIGSRDYFPNCHPGHAGNRQPGHGRLWAAGSPGRCKAGGAHGQRGPAVQRLLRVQRGQQRNRWRPNRQAANRCYFISGWGGGKHPERARLGQIPSFLGTLVPGLPGNFSVSAEATFRQEGW